jgi:hypothetical protein
MIVNAVDLTSRGARVVCDTETRNDSVLSTSALTRLVLPAPEGAVTINSVAFEACADMELLFFAEDSIIR